jgi:hypothetical protein
LTELCANGCESGVMVVVRGTGDERPTEDIGISATLSASASSPDLTNASPLGTTLSLVDDEAEQFLGDPPLILDHVASKIAVSEATPTAHIGLRLRAEPQRFSDPLTYPQGGRLTLRVTGGPAAHDHLWQHWAASIGRLTVNGESMGLAPESGAYDIDWLRLCTAGEPCDVEVGVDIEYEDLLFRARVNGSVANESAAPPPPEFRLTLDAVARLEAFDGGELGSDGLTLEVAQ